MCSLPFYIFHACNTIERLEVAKTNGAKAVECDVFLTVHGQIIVGHEVMEELTLEQAHKRGFMTLDKWLKWCQANNMAGLIELKGKDTEVMPRLVDAIKTMESLWPELFANMSFQSFSVAAIEALDNVMSIEAMPYYPYYLLFTSSPEYAKIMEISTEMLERLGYNKDEITGDEDVETWMARGLNLAKELGCTGIAPFHDCLSPIFMCLVREHSAPMQVIPWTLRGVEPAMSAAVKANAIIHELDSDGVAQVEDWRMGSACMAKGPNTQLQICNEWNRASAKFCRECGAKLGSEG